jgi:hypothetical protein
VPGAALWLTAKLSLAYLSALSALRDEASLLLLILVGTLVYAGSVLSLFGRGLAEVAGARLGSVVINALDVRILGKADLTTLGRLLPVLTEANPLASRAN